MGLCKIIIVAIFYHFLASKTSHCFRILGIFPYNGKSHHIIFSALMEELAERNNDVTVINYFPMKKIDNLKQISLQDEDPNEESKDTIDLQVWYDGLPYYFREFYTARRTAEAFGFIANTNCQRIIRHPQILKLIRNDKFDLIITEQFVTDCALGLIHHFKSPSIGIAAHVLMPWTYDRFGIPNNPSFVPNHFIGTGTKPDLWGRIKSMIINWYFKLYYKHIIQTRDLETIRKILPNTPDLERVAKNLTLLLINEYFPFTGSRVFPTNVVEVGGMHIKQRALNDKDIRRFIEEATDGVVCISLGTVANTTSLPDIKVNGLISFIRSSRLRFIWKREDSYLSDAPSNLMIREWIPQIEILCHPKVIGFISHSGMLGSAEAIHCGVPIINVPLFGDQFANAASARESGAGVTVEYDDFDEDHIRAAVQKILQPEHVARVKQLSSMWRDRPSAALDTAVFWAEYVARHGGAPQLKPPTVDLPLHQYLMLDALAAMAVVVVVLCSVLKMTWMIFVWSLGHRSSSNLNKKEKVKSK